MSYYYAHHAANTSEDPEDPADQMTGKNCYMCDPAELNRLCWCHHQESHDGRPCQCHPSVIDATNYQD